MTTNRFRTPAQVVAILVLAAYLAGCTRQVARPGLDTRHFAVDWAASSAEPFTMNSLNVRGIVLTPAQWPLEGSLKRLFTGDFVGVIDALDLNFRSSTLPDGALREIFDAGFLPVYVQVHNEGAESGGFFPELLVVKGAPRREFSATPAANLPERLTKIDWERTATVTLAALLLVVVIVAGSRGDSKGGDLSPLADVGTHAIITPGAPQPEAFSARHPGASAPAQGEPGMLTARVLAPGETIEGFVFFAHNSQSVDWSTARLAAP